MKPVDFRNETFDQVRERVEGQRAAVLGAWAQHGPCTTRELADRSGISLLTLRPRTTELVELGFVRLAETQTVKGEGTYRAATPAEAASSFRAAQQAALNPQIDLALS
jgi:DNA-binding IclR family transcriptional regulator